MLFPVTSPRAAGEGGERASTPTARGAQTSARSAAAGHSVILTLHGPPPGERSSIAPSASRRTAHPCSTSPAARARKGEVSLPPAAGAAHAPSALGGCGHQRRASGESGTADRSRSRDLSTPAGNKSRVRTSRRDQPRLREGERGGEGSGSSCRPAPRLPEGATAPRPGVAQGAPQWGWGPSARWPQGFSGPARPDTLLPGRGAA